MKLPICFLAALAFQTVHNGSEANFGLVQADAASTYGNSAWTTDFAATSLFLDQQRRAENHRKAKKSVGALLLVTVIALALAVGATYYLGKNYKAPVKIPPGEEQKHKYLEKARSFSTKVDTKTKSTKKKLQGIMGKSSTDKEKKDKK